VSGRSQGEGTARPQAGVPPAFRQRRPATSPPRRVIQFPDAAAQERVRLALGDVLDIHRLGQDVFERAAPAQTGHRRTPRRLSGYPAPGPGSCRGRYHTDRSPAVQAIRRVASALMAMEALVQPPAHQIGGRFYVAQFFDRATGDVLAGPVPDVPLDPAGRAVGRTAHQPCNGSREGSTSCCPAIRNIRSRPSEGEGEAGATRAKTRPASLSLHRGMTSLHE
jgi:hypothetical protein